MFACWQTACYKTCFTDLNHYFSVHKHLQSSFPKATQGNEERLSWTFSPQYREKLVGKTSLFTILLHFKTRYLLSFVKITVSRPPTPNMKIKCVSITAP